jgi:hypothetical protein
MLMAKMQRSKGARVERLMVQMHHDAGIPCEKVSRSGYTGEDLMIADEFRGEVKARKEPMKTAIGWLAGRDLLFVKPDREPPMVIMTWDTYVALMRR